MTRKTDTYCCERAVLLRSCTRQRERIEAARPYPEDRQPMHDGLKMRQRMLAELRAERSKR